MSDTSAPLPGGIEASLRERIVRLTNFLDQDRANDSLRQELFDCLLTAREFEQARQIADEAWREGRSPAWQYRRAVAARLNGQAAEAVADLRNLVGAGIHELSVVLELARAEVDAGDAVSAAQRLGAIDVPGMPLELAESVMVTLVPALMATGALAKAIALCQQFLTRHPGSGKVMGMLGTALLDAEQLDDARALVEASDRAGILDPNLSTVAGFVDVAAGRVVRARERFGETLRVAPSVGRAHLGMGLVCAYDNELAAARRSFSTAVSIMPTHLGSWHALAWIQLLQDDLPAAEATFMQAMAQDHNFGDTHGGLAIVAALRGQQTSAQEHIRTGKRLDRFSVNVGVAEAILAQPGGLHSADTLRRAFETFQRNTLARSPAMQTSFSRLLANQFARRSQH